MKTNSVKTEKMCLEDLNEINLEEFDDFWNINMLKEELCSPTSYYIIAKCEKNIIGFAGINLILDEAHLANIVVKKNMRGLKIGSLLLETIINFSKNKASTITLEVNEKNIPAINLYQNHGFEIVR